jgi:hypothetical protein
MQPDFAFRYARAVPLSLQDIRIEWALYLSAEVLANFRLRILRSSSPLGPFDIVADNLPMSTMSFTDSSQKIVSILRDNYWYVEVYNLAGTFTKRSGDISISHAYDKIAMAMIAKSDMILRNPHKGVGVRCALLPMRLQGQRCTSCWDGVKNRQKISDCPVCFATGFEMGYMNPVEMWFNMAPQQSNLQIMDISQNEDVKVSAWTQPSPEIVVNDVIVVLDRDDRYRVNNQRPTIRRGAMLRQMVSLTMLNRRSIEYRIPVNL